MGELRLHRLVLRRLVPIGLHADISRPRTSRAKDDGHRLTSESTAPEAVASFRHVVIAMILRPTGETGVQTHVQELRRFLDALGVRCTIVTPFDVPMLLVAPVFGVRRVLARVCPALGVWWYRYWHARFLRVALRHKLRRTGRCIVYAQCPVSADVALRVRRDERQQVAMAVHFNLSQADEWAGKGALPRSSRLFASIRRFEVDLLPRVDRLVFVSMFMRDHLHRAHPRIRQIPSMVVPNFVGPDDAPEHVEAIGDLISIGTLEPRKNQRFLIEVVAAARELGRRYCLTLVGDGPDREILVRAAAEHGVLDAVLFTGYVQGARSLLHSHRVYVHAAKTENLGIALLEALAAGLPVFAPATGGIPEVFRDGCEGFFWSLDDPWTAARLLIEVLDDDDAYARASAAARRRYTSSFSPEILGPRLVAALGLNPIALGRQGE